MKTNYNSRLTKILKKKGKLSKLKNTPRDEIIKSSSEAFDKLKNTFSETEKRELYNTIKLVEKGEVIYVK